MADTGSGDSGRKSARMKHTYTTGENGRLTLTMTQTERRELARSVKAMAKEQGWTIDGAECQKEYDILDQLSANTELDVIRAEDIGALTSAPILGLRGDSIDEIVTAWAYMDYAVRSFVRALIDTGKAVFTS